MVPYEMYMQLHLTKYFTKCGLVLGLQENDLAKGSCNAKPELF